MVCDDLKATVGKTNTLGAMRVLCESGCFQRMPPLRCASLIYHLEMLFGHKTARLSFFYNKKHRRYC
jgi:hypothetical protein